MNKSALSFLRAFVSISLIVILLYIMRDKYGEIALRLKTTNLWLFLLAFLVFSAAIAIASLRLKFLIEAQEFNIKFIECLSLTFIGYFFNNFLPTTIGGDVVKAYYLSKKTQERISAFASVFVDRAIGLATMIFMAFIALFFAPPDVAGKTVRYSIYAITALSALGIIFVTSKTIARKFSVVLYFLKPLEEKLKKAYNVVYKYKHHRLLMGQSIIISIASQLLFFASLGILAHSIGSNVTTMEIVLRMPIISTLSLLPSINGLGFRESSTVLLFGPLIGEGNAFAVSLLWLVVLLATSVIGGIIYGVSPQFKVNIKEVD